MHVLVDKVPTVEEDSVGLEEAFSRIIKWSNADGMHFLPYKKVRMDYASV